MDRTGFNAHVRHNHSTRRVATPGISLLVEQQVAEQQTTFTSARKLHAGGDRSQHTLKSAAAQVLGLSAGFEQLFRAQVPVFIPQPAWWPTEAACSWCNNAGICLVARQLVFLSNCWQLWGERCEFVCKPGASRCHPSAVSSTFTTLHSARLFSNFHFLPLQLDCCDVAYRQCHQC